MACVDTLNISSDLNSTPSRKRKRQFEKVQQQLEENSLKTAPTSCFTNAAFSSTPKKVFGKRRLHLNPQQKENVLAFVPNIGLEVKSIAEIVKNNNAEFNSVPNNPYEVLRKPPKKKKRQADDVACFENPALNLELPEKQFNPYEVVRDVVQSANTTNCFVNPALNLKIEDAPATRNPFEIRREIPNQAELLNLKARINPALRNPFEIPREEVKEPVVGTHNPCSLRIGLPFMPNVGCRIDFRDMSMSQLTPSKLLAEKLVFSPVPKAKLSLGSIGEETTMDIGKELDQYQLELENSINEAKLRKNGIVDEGDSNIQIQIVDVEKKIKFTQKLSEITEDGENEDISEETTEQTEHKIQIHISKDQNKNPFEYDSSIQEMKNEKPRQIIKPNQNPFEYNSTEEEINQEVGIDDADEPKELNECSDNDPDAEDSFDFITPAPFVRAYTKAAVPKLTVSKESLKDENSKSFENEEHSKKPMNVKNMIRKSIRKLMHPHQHDQEHKDSEFEIHEKPEHDKHNGLINCIRQSLRRKPTRNILEEETENKEYDVSIIDSSERTTKLKSEFIHVEDLTYEKKHNIRNSIRKSTREVRNHFMKSVFHKKHDEYDFNK